MMGAQDGRLRADAWFGGISSSVAALDVYLTPLAAGDGVKALVSLVTWDVYALSTESEPASCVIRSGCL